MSIILEALKKSENQRQRQSGPGFANVPERVAHGGRSVWPLLVVALLALNTAILAYFLLRGSPAPAASPAETLAGAGAPAVEPETVRRQPTAAPPVAATPAVPVRTAAPPPGTPAREVRSLEAEAGAPTSTGAAPAIPTRLPPAATAEPRAGRAPLPTATELMLKGELGGPPLNLELHVYYPEPARRVVFINGRKYREGERLASGPLVREIVADGVVLTEDGRPFLLQAE